MTAVTSFIDSNVWLYRLFDDKKIEEAEIERKLTFTDCQVVEDTYAQQKSRLNQSINSPMTAPSST